MNAQFDNICGRSFFFRKRGGRGLDARNRINASCHNRHTDYPIKFSIKCRANDNIRIFIHLIADQMRGFVDFVKCQVAAACNIDKYAFSAFERYIIEERVIDGGLCSFDRAVITRGFACAHHGFTHFVHYGANIIEVEINQARNDHEVRDAPHARMQHFISHRKSIRHCRLLCRHSKEVLVRNCDHGVNRRIKVFNTLLCEFHAAGAFEHERLCDDPNCQNAFFTRSPSNHRRRARACAAAHTSRDE